MTRANATLVKAALNGTLVGSWTSTTVNTQCVYADADIDNYAGENAISTTSTVAIGIALDIVFRRMQHVEALRRQVGAVSAEGVAYGNWEPLTDELKERIRNAGRGTSSIEPLVEMYDC